MKNYQQKNTPLKIDLQINLFFEFSKTFLGRASLEEQFTLNHHFKNLPLRSPKLKRCTFFFGYDEIQIRSIGALLEHRFHKRD